jgi:formylglycine-generating enzyme required for sulfatase activity
METSRKQFVSMCALMGFRALNGTAFAQTGSQGRTYVILVGINKYAKQGQVQYAVEDVDRLAKLFAAKYKAVLQPRAEFDRSSNAPRIQMIKLTSEESPESPLYPTLENIEVCFRQLSLLSEQDNLILVWCGHGQGLKAEDDMLLLPVNADTAAVTQAGKKMIQLSELKGYFKARIKKAIFIIDACRDNLDPKRGNEKNQLTESMKRGMGVLAKGLVANGDFAVFLACKPGQSAGWDGTLKQGIFTHFLVQELEANPYQSLRALAGKVQTEVQKWTKSTQIPDLSSPGINELYLSDATPPVRTVTLTINANVPGITISANTGKVVGNQIMVTFKSDVPIPIKGTVRAPGYDPVPFATLLYPGKPETEDVTLSESGRKRTRHEIAAEKTRQPRPNRPEGYPALADYLEQMCAIPGQTFEMGSNSGRDDEKPVHSVTLTDYFLGKTPVTVALWKEYAVAVWYPNKPIDKITESEWVSAMPPKPSWGWLDDHPVVNVNWDDIMGKDGSGKRADGKQAFCAWVKEMSGYVVSLPSEAQWECGARGGKKGEEYPWGKDFDKTKVWCSGETFGDAKQTGAVVRSSRIYTNAHGLTDMVGNVYQWCADYFAPKFYATTEATKENPMNSVAVNDPAITTDASYYGRTVRGGCWWVYDTSWFLCAHRGDRSPDYRDDFGGFRLCAAS